ncbi:MAG: MlaD family protein [Bacteroidota bacterium]|nr:MlaD family protein [Bacteroidota bacterium]
MNRRTQKIRLGIFIVFGNAILITLIVFFAANKLFEKTDTYFIAYNDVSVSGLEVGSPVKYLGIRIGTIAEISIDPQDINSIIVELAVEPGTPIKNDTRADIVTMGITGLKAIEIRGGSNQSSFKKTRDYINAGSSTAEEITGKATIIAEKTERVINNLQIFTEPENLNKFTDAAENINFLADQLKSTTQLFELLIRENRSEIRETVKTAHLIAGNLNESSQTINEAANSINNVIKGDTIQRILGNAHAISLQLKETDLKTLIHNLAEMTEQTRVLLYKIDQELDLNSQEFNESVRLLKITLSNLEQTSNKISSDPSILVRGLGDKDIPDRRLNNK